MLPLPKVHFASADVDKGTQAMLLEDLNECVQLGLFFGAGSPLNWGKDLKALTAPLPDLSVAKVRESTRPSIGRLRGPALLLSPFAQPLRASSFLIFQLNDKSFPFPLLF